MIKARSDKAIKSEVENGSDTYRAVHRPQKKIKKPDAGRACRETRRVKQDRVKVGDGQVYARLQRRTGALP